MAASAAASLAATFPADLRLVVVFALPLLVVVDLCSCLAAVAFVDFVLVLVDDVVVVVVVAVDDDGAAGDDSAAVNDDDVGGDDDDGGGGVAGSTALLFFVLAAAAAAATDDGDDDFLQFGFFASDGPTFCMVASYMGVLCQWMYVCVCVDLCECAPGSR